MLIPVYKIRKFYIMLVIAAIACLSPVFSSGEDEKSLLSEAARLHSAGDFSGAIARFKDVIRVNPDSAEALFMLGSMNEKGEGGAVDQVEAAKYFRKAWSKGHKEAYARLEAMYTSALAPKKAPPEPSPQLKTEIARKAADSAESVVIDIPNEMLSKLRGVHFRSSDDDRYSIVLTCPDNCSDLNQKAAKIAAVLGGAVAEDQPTSRSVTTEHFEYISLRTEAPHRSFGEAASEISGALDLKITCKGWCRVIKVITKSVAEILGELDQSATPENNGSS